MKKFLTLTLLVGSVAALIIANAQETTNASNNSYQVPGFPQFVPAPTMIEVVEDRGETVVVRHEYGEVEIPKNPQRVFADAQALQTALLLDLNIVGADYYPGLSDIPSLAEAFTDIPDVLESASGDLNYERVLALDPDLIIAPGHLQFPASGDPATAYAQLSQIAPTITFADNAFVYWQEAALDLGRVFDMEDEVNSKLETFEQDLAAACAPLQQAIGNESAVHITFYATSPWMQSVGQPATGREGMKPAGDTRWLYIDCQIAPPDNLTELMPPPERWLEITGEQIPDLTADHIFLLLFDDEAVEGYEEILSSPLWQAVPAVQAGNAYIMPPIGGFDYDSTLYTISRAVEAIEQASE
ncbi:MAG: ABC transporter substrate-binding protein [Deinococcota bacterium]